MIYETICRPIEPYTRRKPCYEVVSSTRAIDAVRPHAILKSVGLKWLVIPTNRRIMPQTVINPTREVKAWQSSYCKR